MGAALRGRPEETAGAGALSAKHEEIPLGYPHPTVNSRTNFPLSIFNYLMPSGLFVIPHPPPQAAVPLPLWEGCPSGYLFAAGAKPPPYSKLVALRNGQDRPLRQQGKAGG